MEPEDLYGLPLERFVAARTELARSLRQAGRREEAAAVAKLAKPAVAAWAVNQLIRTQRQAVAELFDAGQALQDAQAAVLDGRGSAGGLREAATRERDAVAALLQAADGLLSAEGHGLSATIRERVGDTLHAAALDADARAQVQGGCLTAPLQHIGLGGAGGLTGPREPEPEPADPERARALAAAQAAEASARAELEQAQAELDAAEQRREQAARTLREAQDAAEAAQRRAADAALAHRRAEQALLAERQRA